MYLLCVKSPRETISDLDGPLEIGRSAGLDLICEGAGAQND